MKRLLISILFAILFVVGCSDQKKEDDATNTVAIIWDGDFATMPYACTPEHANHAYRNTTDKKSYFCNGSAWQIIAVDGSDGQDGDQAVTVVSVSNPSGFAEAGPFQGYSEVTMWPLNTEFKQMGDPVIGNTKADDSGSFTVYADLSGSYIKTIVRGRAFNETSAGFDENVVTESTIPASSTAFNANHFSSIVSIVANYWYHEAVASPYYHNPLAFDAAESIVMDYFDYSGNWQPSVKKSYEMTLTGNTLDDAKLVMINSTIALNNDGPAQGLLMQKIAEDIYTGAYALQSQINAVTNNLLIGKIHGNLNKYYSDRSLNYKAAPVELLPGIPDYYDAIWNGSHEIIEGHNMNESSSCTIDTAEYNSFAYYVPLEKLSEAAYLISELTGAISIWSVGICDNGTVTFACPVTKMLEISEMKEILIEGPGISYNGVVPVNNYGSGAYFVVVNTSNPSAPSHICTGELTGTYRNLATLDNNWTAAIGYNNPTSWFRRVPKIALVN